MNTKVKCLQGSIGFGSVMFYDNAVYEVKEGFLLCLDNTVIYNAIIPYGSIEQINEDMERQGLSTRFVACDD